MANATDLVFKKIVGRQYTTTAKSWYEEYPGVPFNLYSTDVWIDIIPSIPPTNSTAIVHVYNTLTLVEDATVSVQKSWLAEDPPGTRIGKFIPPRFGQGYTVRVFDADDDEIPTTDPVNWFFDYDFGILTFDNDPGSYGWNDSAFKVKTYRYVGETVEDIVISGSAGSRYASEIINDSTVSGSNVAEALDALAGSLDTSKFKFNQYLSTVSGLQIYSLPDVPVFGTVQIFLNGLLQEPPVDYTISGDIVTFAVPNDPSDILLSHYIIP
jgi:hypothetical protein